MQWHLDSNFLYWDMADSVTARVTNTYWVSLNGYRCSQSQHNLVIFAVWTTECVGTGYSHLNCNHIKEFCSIIIYLSLQYYNEFFHVRPDENVHLVSLWRLYSLQQELCFRRSGSNPVIRSSYIFGSSTNFFQASSSNKCFPACTVGRYLILHLLAASLHTSVPLKLSHFRLSVQLQLQFKIVHILPIMEWSYYYSFFMTS